MEAKYGYEKLEHLNRSKNGFTFYENWKSFETLESGFSFSGKK